MLPHHTKLTKYLFFTFLVVILIYAYFEAQNILFGPQIYLGTQSATTVQTERINIKGIVKNVSFLALDGRPLLVDRNGKFNEVMLLVRGLNVFTFTVEDRFGRKSEKKLSVVYEPTNNTKLPKQTKQEPATIQ